MIVADGPALSSRLRTDQAVLRFTPSAIACLAAESNPAATKAPRISATFEICLAFAFAHRL